MALNRHDDFDFSDGRQSQFDEHPDLKMEANGLQPAHLQRNKTERRRLQGLQRSNTALSRGPVKIYEPKTFMEKWQHWMINEGGKRLFFSAWVFLHLLVIAFGALNYGLKDDLVTARATFGITYRAFLPFVFQLIFSVTIHSTAIARAAALVLHIDVIFILLPVCRNFVSLLRRTPLNHVIPFDKNLTFHKATAWSMVFFTGIHIGAHMVNFTRLAMADPDAKTAGAKFVAFLNANFATGPGVTGWIMTASLGIIVFFAAEKRRRANFERFWYSHHLFIVFFICWQLHGMFCMIKPDRPPYCSWNSIGVFWVRYALSCLSLP